MKDIKIILFDVDGVIINPPHYFSKELKLKGYKSAEDNLNVYYGGPDHITSLEGKSDSEELILPYLKNLGWEHSADEYLMRQFEYEQSFLDKDMIHIIDKLRTQGVKCCLATDQEKRRAKYLLDEMNFRNIFDIHYISCYMGFRKSAGRFWEYVINELKKDPLDIEPSEIVFFDDLQKNIDTALKFGVKALLFETMSKFREDLALLGLDVIFESQPG